MEKDLTGFDGGLNAYVYANGDPINMVDPSGTDPVGCVADVFSCIPGAIGEVANRFSGN